MYSNKKLRSLIIEVTALLIAFITLSVYVYTAIQEDSAQYKEDTKCISLLISKGYERKDIALIKGTCVVGENFYYKYQ
ncbi:hypothetical protein PYDG_00004 [Pseudoalteromonas phage pYD6-A]|uniref:Uncharacterized protein n=1 Tax=Pseudoalteromonas phage pYD6-A TaxID=754052 RepID=M4SRV9_9CAUD|nr:hypothetical protein PYDG_00004 [Pseudoalteromonas phage pYD6-A]AGH57536.1 hypothetical protein PYDG_00004 [Pseudoalteromonas phage pYD6-A]